MEDAIARVAASLEVAAGSEDDLSHAFFESYLKRCPDSRALMEHMDDHMRGRMMSGIYDLMLVASDEDQRRYMAFELDNHTSYGARPHMYEHLFDALLESVREACGEAWTEDWEQAWRARMNTLLTEAQRFHASA